MNNNIPTMTAQEALDELTTHLLGKDYYIADQVSGPQANAIIVEEIKKRYMNEDKVSKIVKYLSIFSSIAFLFVLFLLYFY